MSNVKISELADGTITLSSFIALASSSGVAFKGTVNELQTFVNTIAVLGLKSAVLAADAAPTEDGLYPCSNSGTYANFGGLVIDLSNTISFISVSSGQTVFKKVEVPVSIVIDEVPTEGSTDAVQSGGVFNEFKYNLQNKADSFISSSNLLDKSRFILGKAINSTGAIISISSAYYLSPYQRIDPSTNYYFNTNNGSNYICQIYDKDFLPIGSNVTTKAFTTTSDAYYIACNIKNTELNITQLELGSTETDYSNFEENLSDSIYTSQGDEFNSANNSIGDWIVNRAGVPTFNVNEIDVLSGSQTFSGCRLGKDLDENVIYYVEFEAKIKSGVIRDWYLTNSDLGTSNELFQPTSEYKRFYIEITTTLANRRLNFYQSINESGNTLSFRNFWYSNKNNLSKNTTDKIKENIKLINTKPSFDDKKGSLESYVIPNEISDLLRPDRKGKIEFLDSDLFPSINNVGDGYLFDNAGTTELRIVKDATSIFGIPITSKATNTVTPTTFSITYFGDSITNGVGAYPSFPQRTNTKLTSDGHTISNYTEHGNNGYDAKQAKDYADGLTPLAHDVAVLMIGINDIEHQITKVGGYTGSNATVTDILPNDFRALFKVYLSELITSISTYSSYSKLFLVVPTPQIVSQVSSDRQAANPLMQIVIQEYIEYYNNNLSTVNLCRGDYYLLDATTSEIPDGIHPNNTGADLLAKGVRDEITFRV
jgi:lysophospholipase L1-like esterase